MNLRNIKTVTERRKTLERQLGVKLPNIGQFSLDESVASTRNCENMIGVAQVPVGVAGPLVIKRQASSVKREEYYLPLATTEGALVASVSRGCKAITESGGASVNSHRVGATRGPVFRIENLIELQKFSTFLESHFETLKSIAEKTSHYLTLENFSTAQVGKYYYIRFVFDTQDAMGMNMVTIATQQLAAYLEQKLGVRCISVSGNFCTDKKVSWQNVVNNRGMKVWAEATISQEVLQTILKTNAQAVYEVWLAKCMIGSAISGTVGTNAQAANVIAAMFLATGQDLGHIGEGSVAFTTTEVTEDNLYISVYLPDLMVGTVGGGTGLATQREALELLGVFGGKEGKNSQALAEIIGATVLAGELSLLASLAEGTLSQAHQKLGRGKG
ncbi:3-hydroxy-3-methylglutaryl-CoA reductase [Candidatus Microgenomates bacterium]|nr:MAG: 3-hydroxy-3-methylglutaryl-CoA reductase [Candidatus Microgenomates bacterium]